MELGGRTIKDWGMAAARQESRNHTAFNADDMVGGMEGGTDEVQGRSQHAGRGWQRTKGEEAEAEAERLKERQREKGQFGDASPDGTFEGEGSVEV